MSMKRTASIGFIVAAFVFILDQASKAWVLSALSNPPYKIEVTSFLNLIQAWNRGVTFGLLKAGNPYAVWVLIGVALLLSCALVIWIFQAENKMISSCFGLILGGALGNILDRIRFEAVTDFLDFHIMGYHWYTFNGADTAIVIGVALILIDQMYQLYKEKCLK